MLKCYCGNEMVQKPMSEYIEESRLSMRKALASRPPPGHRKRRIAKKWAKRHAARMARLADITALMMVPIRRRLGTYRCTSCNATMGGYQAVARACFVVEPLPPGALPYYFGEPPLADTVARIVTNDEKQALVEKAVADLEHRDRLKGV